MGWLFLLGIILFFSLIGLYEYLMYSMSRKEEKEYAIKMKDNAEINYIVFYVNDSLLLKEKFDFYRKALIHNGFKTIDNIKFTYKLD